MLRAVPTGPPPQTPTTTHARASRWRALLLWAGAAACIAGIVGHDLFAEWVPSRTTALLVIVLAALALAAVLRRVAGLAWAHGLLLAWLLALLLFAGPLPVLATLACAAAAIALGRGLLPDAGVAAACAIGLALVAGVLGWLLPLPVHGRWTYLAAIVVVLALRGRDLAGAMRQAWQGWHVAVAGAPRAAAAAVLVAGLAGTGCWVPTVQYDDLGYHALLPWMLQIDGRHALDPDMHAWAVAPWAADVVQALPQVLAGMEARGAVNALWLALTATALWQLCAALGGDARQRWWTVALYASLPLTAVLAMGMQTELQTAALLAWAAVLALRPPSVRTLWAACALVGALVATKLAAAGFAAMLLPWLLWRQRQVLGWRSLSAGLALIAGLGGSSYAYAACVAGNPVLPLLNGVFGSPYFATQDFDDPRWHAGAGPDLAWQLTFDTGRYLEAYAGGGGFVLVALAGAWLLALLAPRTRALAALALAMAVAPLLATQYLRYAQPALVLVLPALVVAAAAAAPRSAHVLLAATCVANLLFQANGHWMLRTGIVKETVMAAGRDAPVWLEYAPERVLAQQVHARRAAEGGRGTVLSLASAAPMAAEFGAAARTIGWYDPSLQAAAQRADQDASGRAWAGLLRSEHVRDVLLRPGELHAARAAGLRAVGATREAAAGAAEWWRVPPRATVASP
ncbi:hypothetical protein [Luteimonas sp. MC1825]|uniref:hypothetical protein n=1 Tax=Luteimonas sp. MC1825 TaxID=2761107 RepID=UPI00160A3CBA|nr:hypothetical protein [Luteimonas sp. MC1825]MBB6598312.1 hypothetical protein [Luteimonas sp. MC1825]QOC88522.1 hypothetical protein IDM46_01785 [Luteimonas sp. MC1825]